MKSEKIRFKATKKHENYATLRIDFHDVSSKILTHYSWTTASNVRHDDLKTSNRKFAEVERRNP